MENFHKLKKIDFDFVLAGFNHGAQKKGSMKLMKMFVACVVQNYASEGNIKHEDFILAATSVSKDRDKQLTDKTFWELAVKVMMEYISKDDAITEDDLDNDYRLDDKNKSSRDRTTQKSNPSLAALCLKLISQNIAEAMSQEQSKTFFDYIMRRSVELNSFDRTSLLKSMTDIKTFTF